jgi:DNA-binding response OmpR family regulator
MADTQDASMVQRITNQDSAQQTRQNHKGRILLVHDDPGSLMFHLMILHQQGFSVRSCSSYEEGIRSLDSEAFDFVIVSQGGPGFEGSSVVEHAMDAGRRLPVLVLTRFHDMRCYLDAMHRGAVDYLEEPLTGSELSRVIETHRRRPQPAVGATGSTSQSVSRTAGIMRDVGRRGDAHRK